MYSLGNTTFKKHNINIASMGRPRLNEEKLRIHQLNLSLTAAEFEYAKMQAEIYGQSVTAWCRKAAFSKRPLLQPKITPMHRAYYKQLVGLSNNTNQIAKRLNKGEYTKIHDELCSIRQLLVQINQLFHDSQTD